MFIFFVDDVSYWSESDLGKTDGRKYYKAPKNIEIGTPCKLNKNKAVPFTKKELEHKAAQDVLQQKRLKLVNKIKREATRRIQTIPAKIRKSLGMSNKDRYYKGDQWLFMLNKCQSVLQNKADNEDKNQAALFILNRIDVIDSSANEIIAKIEKADQEILNTIDFKNSQMWRDLPLPI